MMLNTTAIPMQQFDQPEKTATLQLLGQFIGRHIVVVGDAMLDHYVMGCVNRISPEAPVPVLEFVEESHTLGGAANVAKCAAALGAEVELIAVVGSDPFGEKLKSIGKDLGIQVESLLVDHSRPTTSKTRIVAGAQHVLRLDRECRSPISEILQRRIILNIERCAKSADAFILSDYAKGVLSHSVCQAAITASAGKPVIVDPKGPDWHRYDAPPSLSRTRPKHRPSVGARSSILRMPHALRKISAGICRSIT
jgi:rfaE bifunctional protein kinase chain/domain